MRRNPLTLITLFSLALLFGCATPQPTTGAAGSHSTDAGGRQTQATVVLRITITGDGAPPSAVEVEKSSGYRMLDQAAVESVKKRTSWPSKTGHVYTQSFTFAIP
jgi:TonB family protein